MRNQEKLGELFNQQASSVDESPVVAKQVEEFSFISPTTLVELPSKGKLYSDGHSCKDKNEVEIYFMSGKSEDILTNKALIKKGVAIDRMLQSLLVDKTINLDSLLIGDKNALIVEARITGYGEIYKTKFTCPACEDASDYEFDLEKAKKIHIGDAVEGVSSENGIYTCTLPKCKAVIKFKLMTGKEEKELLYSREKRKQNNLPDSFMTDQLKAFIVSINNREEKEYISKVVDMLPAGDARWLRGTYKQVCPNLELKEVFVCPKCGYEEEVNVPLNADFFWTDR